LKENRKDIKTISLTSVKWFFLIIWFFEPAYFSDQLQSLHRLYTYMRILSSVIISFELFILVFQNLEYKPSLFVYYIISSGILLIFSSWLNSEAEGIFVIFYTVFLSVPFLIYLDYSFYICTKDIISVLLLIFEILIYGNLLTMLLFPNGLYNQGVTYNTDRRYYLLGHQNQVIIYILIGLMLSFLHTDICMEKRISVRTIVLIIASYYMEFSFMSATGITGLLIFSAIVLLSELKHIYIDLKWAILLSVILFLIFIIYNTQSMFSNILVNVFHRDITASSRTIVWGKALLLIRQKPILGYGIENTELSTLRFGFITPHNRILYLLYRGGVILLLFFGGLVFSCGRRLRAWKDQIASRYIGACLFALLIQMQFESYAGILIYIPIIVGLCIFRNYNIDNEDYSIENPFCEE